jgi:hypothetical protein
VIFGTLAANLTSSSGFTAHATIVGRNIYISLSLILVRSRNTRPSLCFAFCFLGTLGTHCFMLGAVVFMTKLLQREPVRVVILVGGASSMVQGFS